MKHPTAAAVVALGTALVATATLAPTASATSPDTLQSAKAASAKYHSTHIAARDGFTSENEPCVSSPDGVMGVHHVNGRRLGDGVDALAPEILLYAPDKNGRDVLVGVEYLKIDDDGDLATDADRPSLFGRPFDGPMPGHAPGMPAHYDLHVWFWAANPSGMFAPFNPALSCG